MNQRGCGLLEYLTKKNKVCISWTLLSIKKIYNYFWKKMTPNSLFALGKIDSDEKLIRAALTWVSLRCNLLWREDNTALVFHICQQLNNTRYSELIEQLIYSELFLIDSVKYLKDEAPSLWKSEILNSSINVSKELYEWVVDLFNLYINDSDDLNQSILKKYSKSLGLYNTLGYKVYYMNEVYIYFISKTFLPLFNKKNLSNRFIFFEANGGFLFGRERQTIKDGVKVKIIYDSVGFSFADGFAIDSKQSGIHDTIVLQINITKSWSKVQSFYWFFLKDKFMQLNQFKQLIDKISEDIYIFQRKLYKIKFAHLFYHEIGHNKTIPLVLKVLNQFKINRNKDKNISYLNELKEVYFEIAADLYCMKQLINSSDKMLLLLFYVNLIENILDKNKIQQRTNNLLIKEHMVEHNHYFTLRILISKDPIKKLEELNLSFERVMHSRDLQCFEQWLIDQKIELENEVKELFAN